MSLVELVTVGYFSYDCQEDGRCNYGCGKRPATMCHDCVWANGEPVPSNWHPMLVPAGLREDEFVAECDVCGEFF